MDDLSIRIPAQRHELANLSNTRSFRTSYIKFVTSRLYSPPPTLYFLTYNAFHFNLNQFNFVGTDKF